MSSASKHEEHISPQKIVGVGQIWGGPKEVVSVFRIQSISNTPPINSIIELNPLC